MDNDDPNIDIDPIDQLYDEAKLAVHKLNQWRAARNLPAYYVVSEEAKAELNQVTEHDAEAALAEIRNRQPKK